jgi:hypothetical protein
LANLRGQVSNSIADTTAAESAGLSNLGSAANAAMASMAPSFTNAASNDLNYTRDFAKLALARELGLVGSNVASGLGSSSGIGGGFSINGPSGQLGFASGGGMTGSGMSGGAGYTVNPYANTPWYAAPQSSSGAGLQALSGLSGQMSADTAARAGGIAGGAANARGRLSAEGDRGSADIGNYYGLSASQIARDATEGSAGIDRSLASGVSEIGRQADAGNRGILASLADGTRAIDAASGGIDRDAEATYAGLDRTQGDVMQGDVLAQLDRGYGSGMGQLYSAFQQGQRDPRDIFSQVRGDIMALQSPYFPAGRQAMDDFYRYFPPASGTGSGPGQLDPTPYLSALDRAYTPFMTGLDAAYRQGMGSLTGLASQARSGMDNTQSGLGSRFGSTAGSLNSMFDQSSGKVLNTFVKSPLEHAREARELELYGRASRDNDSIAAALRGGNTVWADMLRRKAASRATV